MSESSFAVCCEDEDTTIAHKNLNCVTKLTIFFLKKQNQCTVLDADVADDIEIEEDGQLFHSLKESEMRVDIEELLVRRLVQLESTKMKLQEQLEWNSELDKQLECVKEVQMKTHRVLNLLMQQIQSKVRSPDLPG